MIVEATAGPGRGAGRGFLVEDKAELARARGALRGRVAVVMTMGALHQGHASLLRLARSEADHVVATIFVNPLQFGPAEDFSRYPRTLDADLELCRREGADLVFAPDAARMYAGREPEVRVSGGRLAEILEGESRPGHFDGVLTVVLKLLHLVRPDVAVFGQKDYQQLVLVRAMVRDLDLPVRIVGAPTVREPDGLALSSRNRYLDADTRVSALGLYQALRAGAAAAADGADPRGILAAGRGVLTETPGLDLDYLTLTDVWLGPVTGPGPARLLVAGRVGNTRLIDNIELEIS